jgi:hypothetical protein
MLFLIGAIGSFILGYKHIAVDGFDKAFFLLLSTHFYLKGLNWQIDK